MYSAWQIDYLFGTTLYRIKVENESGRGTGISALTVDGVPETGNNFILLDNQLSHTVVVTLSPGKQS